jgi:hypothetical protein
VLVGFWEYIVPNWWTVPIFMCVCTIFDF